MKPVSKTLISLYILLSCSFVFGQAHGVKKTSNSDLRNTTEIFSISDNTTKEMDIYRLESNQLGQTKIFFFQGKNLVNTRKVDTESAKELDEYFVDQFIAFKYMSKAKSENKCDKKFLLSMRGEKYQVCEADKEKIQIISSFIQKLKKNFI